MEKEIARGRSGSVLVPVDFTHVSDEAVFSGHALAGLMKVPLNLLHVLTAPEKGVAEQKDAVAKKLRHHIASLYNEAEGGGRIKANFTVHSGNLFAVIGKVERRIKPSVIVMGTHGKQGLQHLFGSYALRVVIDADCPVMVVQKRFDPCTASGSILVPVLCESPCPGLVEWVVRMAGMHQKEVVLVTVNKDGRPVNVGSRLPRGAGLHELLTAAGVNVRRVETDPEEDPALQVLDLARKEGLHLIMSMTMTDDPAAGLSYSRWNEKLMFNQAKVPVIFFSNT